MTAFIALATLLGAIAFSLLTRAAWFEPADDAAARPSKRLAGALAALMLAMAAGGYAWLGSPGSLSLGPESAERPVATRQQMAALLDQLAANLQQRPDDAEGWGLLARAYVAAGRSDDAVPAFRKALALRPDNPDLLADCADVLGARQGGSLEGEPARMIERAVAADRNHLKALALSGTVAFNRKDYAGAIAAWQRALQVAPPGHPFAGALNDGIAQARQLAGASSGSTAGRVAGSVSLSPAVAARAAPDDTVFVFARAAEGPRMPLAVLRKRVRDLPFEFVLDDSMAMTPASRLSAAGSVIVSARISKSGNAAAEPGDLQGSTGPVRPGASGLKIEIGESLAR